MVDVWFEILQDGPSTWAQENGGLGDGNGWMNTQLAGQGLKVATGDFEGSTKCSLFQSLHSASTVGSQASASNSLRRKENWEGYSRFLGSRSKPRVNYCWPLLPRFQRFFPFPLPSLSSWSWVSVPNEGERRIQTQQSKKVYCQNLRRPSLCEQNR